MQAICRTTITTMLRCCSHYVLCVLIIVDEWRDARETARSRVRDLGFKLEHACQPITNKRCIAVDYTYNILNVQMAYHQTVLKSFLEIDLD